MPEVSYPGVYVEELTSSSRRIVGLDFSTVGFVGPALSGPVGIVSDLLQSIADFERVYGGLDDLDVVLPSPWNRNHLALAVRAFFENGGARLHVVRIEGTGGALPGESEYRAGLTALRGAQDVRIVAAPGYSARPPERLTESLAIRDALIDHVGDASLYRFAVLDPPPALGPAAVRDFPGSADTSRAALYYPWITIADPSAPVGTIAPIDVPPSGFVCGIYGRVDRERGIWRAPANEELRGALDLARALTNEETEILAQSRVNALRAFVGRGMRVWGGRTLSGDQEWKYVNVRRLCAYLEASIEEGIKWAVFEPNGEALWLEIRRTIENFLRDEWRKGALLGTTEREAFFVRCDRSVMTQDDIDSGRLICLVGVAAVKPAEFINLHVEQIIRPNRRRWWQWLLLPPRITRWMFGEPIR